MKNETEVPQESVSLFQDLAHIPVWAVALLALLGLVLADVMPIWAAVLLLAGWWFTIRHFEKQAELKEAKGRAAAFANNIAPIVVSSIDPSESVASVIARAQNWRNQLQLSGNPYWDKIPVVEFPYSPMLYEVGQLSCAWSIYQKQVADETHNQYVKWYNGKCPAELKALFASAVLPALYNQQNAAQ